MKGIRPTRCCFAQDDAGKFFLHMSLSAESQPEAGEDFLSGKSQN